MNRRRRGTGQPGPQDRPASADPLAGVERVFIDGSNLAWALGRGSGGRVETGSTSVPVPTGAVIGRLRAVFPPGVSVEIVFDGPAVGGLRGRLATGLRVAYSGRATADSVIDEGVAAQLAADGPAGTWGILVVTDDRGLRDLVAAKGARVARTAWLSERVGRVAASVPGRRGSPVGERVAVRGRQPSLPLPRAGTTIGHRRPPRAPSGSGRDED